MAFSSLGQLVGGLERRPEWRSHQQFQAILEHWPAVVGAVVAAQAHPLSIRRHILNISTSSPVWAQNLAFQRHHILTKLSHHIPDHRIKDIRFSAAQWPELRSGKPLASQQLTGNGVRASLKQYHFEQSEARSLWDYHPCQLSQSGGRYEAIPNDSHALSETPVQVFHDWAAQMQARSQHLPKCPSCASPTPAGELRRWGVCSLCAPKKW